MTDDPSNRHPWTEAERAGIRKLLRMAGILLAFIMIAGIIAAFLSTALGTL